MSEDDETKPLKIRPYARLLTMLGEQLIKNERIALIELVKNSYDADAGWADIRFLDFGPNLKKKDTSRIVIEDNGVGMSDKVIESAWMNPATPHKLKENPSDRITKEKKRVIQGEKGIGRFAILKLGRVVEITTRPKRSSKEYVVRFDFSEYDDDFTKHRGKSEEIFLDSISVTLKTRKPTVFAGKSSSQKNGDSLATTHGTRIEISDLKGAWSSSKLKLLGTDALKLQSIFSKLFNEKAEHDPMRFDVRIFVGDEQIDYQERALENLKNLFEHSSVLRIENGTFDNESLEFKFDLNDSPTRLTFDELRGDRWAKERFGEAGTEDKTNPDFGPFGFSFYVFDLKAPHDSHHYLSKEETDLVKQHRVYLYRDGVRVYPYGEKDDDWLGIDILRGKLSASSFLSNDQVIGCIEITHEHNPDLRDKTSREGLIDTGDATEDFIWVLRSLLSHIRSKHFQVYRAKIAKQRREKALREGKPDHTILPLYSHLQKTGDEKGYKLTKALEKSYDLERGVLTQRAETTEDLAAVGIAVETASHDLMLMMDKVVGELDVLISTNLLDEDSDVETLQKIRGMVAFVEHRMKDLQALFKSSKQRRKLIRIDEMVEKVEKIYRSALKPKKVKVDIVKIGPPLAAKCTDAVVMQLLINLFDNALYWLQQEPPANREIRITLDGNDNRLIFSDSGPGISKSDAPFIFDAWFSGKGDEGRGLGLYIARQLLERLDYSIQLAEFSQDKILGGANFVVDFVVGDDE